MNHSARSLGGNGCLIVFANWDSHGIGNNFNKVGYGRGRD